VLSPCDDQFENCVNDAFCNRYDVECAGEHEVISCELQGLGFTEQDAESAINSVSHPSLAVCLDWLCLHIPEEELPLAFAPGKLLHMLFVVKLLMHRVIWISTSLFAFCPCLLTC
jgi:hypothetical protein